MSKAIIRVSAAKDKFLQGYNLETKEHEHFSIVPALYNGLYVAAGDIVKVEYNKKQGEPKNIEKITEWSVKNMKERIVKIIDECIAASKKAANDYGRIQGNVEISDVGKKKRAAVMSSDISTLVEKRIVEIHDIFENKIAELDQQEQKEVESKNKSLEYQQMILQKAEIIKRIDIEKAGRDFVAEYLKEFADYPVAIELLQSCVDHSDLRMQGLVIPTDNRGKRQQAMADYENTLNNALRGLAQLEKGSVSKFAVAESSKRYIMAQNDDFSLHIEDVWENME